MIARYLSEFSCAVMVVGRNAQPLTASGHTFMWGTGLFGRIGALRSSAGSVAILTALALPVLIGMTGAAAETAIWFELKRRAQNAADGAAVAGAIQRARGGTANVVASAKRSATQNGFTNGVGSTTVGAGDLSCLTRRNLPSRSAFAA